jgi:hypothetical protein
LHRSQTISEKKAAGHRGYHPPCGSRASIVVRNEFRPWSARWCFYEQCSSPAGPTLPALLSALADRLDRRLANIILAHARRRWPLLTLIPAAWLGPLASPLATRLRRSLTRGALTT